MLRPVARLQALVARIQHRYGIVVELRLRIWESHWLLLGAGDEEGVGVFLLAVDAGRVVSLVRQCSSVVVPWRQGKYISREDTRDRRCA